MERITNLEAEARYPGEWIAMVDLERIEKGMVRGYVLCHGDEETVRLKKREWRKNNSGMTGLFGGHNPDIREVGGIYVHFNK